MKLKKSIFIFGIFLIIISIISSLLIKKPSISSSSNDINLNKTIILDAGHGGLTNTID